MSLTATMYAPAGVTNINGTNGTVYVVGATGEVTVPVEMIPALLGAGFLETQIEPGTVTNASVAANAAIAYSKLNLAGAILTTDTAFTSVKVSGIQVVGAQQAAIADSVPNNAHDKLNLLLAACRTHGLIAT